MREPNIFTFENFNEAIFRFLDGMGRRSINLGVEVKTTSPKEKILTKAFNQLAILYEMEIFYASAESEMHFKLFCVVSWLGSIYYGSMY